MFLPPIKTSFTQQQNQIKMMSELAIVLVQIS